VFHPSDHSCGPPLDPLQQVHVFLVLGTPELDAVLQVGCQKSKVKRKNSLPLYARHASFYTAQDTIGFLGCHHVLCQANEDAGEGPSRGLPRMSRSAPHIMTALAKKKRRVTVIGNPLLKGTEGPICEPDPSHREVCCLPGARVRDGARKLPGLVRPSDYYPVLVMQVGGDEIAERSPKAIESYFRALGRLVEGSGAQVVFSSIPSVAVKSTERDRKTHLIDRWLRDWCRQRNLGFFDHGEVYIALGLLVTGGVQLSQRGKRILAHELAGLIERALN